MSGKGKKIGRPSKYTAQLAAEICRRLAEGESLRSICRDEKMPCFRAVLDWVIADREGFAQQYTRARDVGLDVLADQVIEISDGKRADPTRDRLRFDARRWYLSKLAPKKYGDKVQTELSGPNGGPLQANVTVTFVRSGETPAAGDKP